MAKRDILLAIVLFAAVSIALLILGLYWTLPSRRPKDSLPEFAARFKQGKVYFEALGREVDIGPDNYFRDDGAVADLDQHSRKLRFEMAGLNLLPLEEIDKMVPEPRDFVAGVSFIINLGGKRFVIIFYEGEGKSQAGILAEKVHEQTHALIRFGKIDLIKDFMKSKNISVEYNQEELYRLCGLDPSQKSLLEIFSDTIRDKETALAEFLAQKMQKYYREKPEGNLKRQGSAGSPP